MATQENQTIKRWACYFLIGGVSLSATGVILDLTNGSQFKVLNTQKVLPIMNICLLMLGAFFLGVGLGIFKGLKEEKADSIDYGNMRKSCFLTTSGILGGGAVFISTLYEIAQPASSITPGNIFIMAAGYFLLGLFIGISKGKKQSIHQEESATRRPFIEKSVSLSTQYK